MDFSLQNRWAFVGLTPNSAPHAPPPPPPRKTDIFSSRSAFNLDFVRICKRNPVSGGVRFRIGRQDGILPRIWPLVSGILPFHPIRRWVFHEYQIGDVLSDEGELPQPSRPRCPLVTIASFCGGHRRASRITPRTSASSSWATPSRIRPTDSRCAPTSPTSCSAEPTTYRPRTSTSSRSRPTRCTRSM